MLTKALGTGVLTTAHKGGLLDDAGVRVATDSMATLNEAPVRLARELGFWPHAATDVTGFSLMGHSCEMAEASGVTLEVDAASVPLMARAREMAALGLIPAGAYRNRDFFGPRMALAEALPLDLTDVLFDPQTSGGLLLALPELDAERLVDALRDEGLPAAVIGRAVLRGEKSVVVA